MESSPPSDPQPIVIETPQFRLTLPGWWRELEAVSPQCVYHGLSENEDRHLLVSHSPLQTDLGTEERREVVQTMLDFRIDREKEIGGERTAVYPVPLTVGGQLAVGSYVAMHPGQGRIVFGQILSSACIVVTILWEVLGVTAPPDMEALNEEFLAIVQTIEFK